MSKPIVLRLGRINYAHEAWEKLQREAHVVTVPASTTREDFLRMLRDPQSELSKVQIIARTYFSVDQTGLFDSELIKALPSTMRAVVHSSAGYDQIDVNCLRERGIQLSNVQDVCNSSTATTHVYLLLSALRNFDYGRKLAEAGQWKATGLRAAGAPIGHDPTGKVVGVLGLGGIGSEVVKRLKPFGFGKFIYHNRRKLAEEAELGCEYVSFEELLKQSDIISINIPLNPSTEHLINEAVIQKMKDNVIIVNTARGSIIDQEALQKAIKSGKVGAVGLDVFENEPEIPQEFFDAPNVSILPHMGTFAYETQKGYEEQVVDNIRSVIDTGKVITLVPELKSEKWIEECSPLK